MKDVYYLFLSGTHRTLPLAEFRGIAEGEGINYELIARLDQVILVKTDEWERLLKSLKRRASLIKYGGVTLGLSEVSDGVKGLRDVLKSINPRDLGIRYLCFNRVKRYGSSIEYNDVLREARRLELRMGSGKEREGVLDVIVSEGLIIVGLRMFRREIKDLSLRSPQLRPSYLPGTMTPLWCRLFVNLSRAGPGKVFLDPFCGVGGFLIEACHMGINYVGCDANPKCVEGSVKNLLYYGCPPNVVVGDARKPPFDRADCIGTDPPYGRLTKVNGSSDLKELMESFINSAAELLHRGSYLVFAQRRDLILEDVVVEAGFKIIERHLNWVHGSLTRDIYVVRRD